MKIKTYEDGSARLLWDWRDIALTTANFETLRAFFQAERDDALGRWRDPENPNVVVYPCLNQDDGYGRVVWVLDEAEMVSGTVLDDRHSHSSASRYFDAHPLPETEPKPWENAKEGDYWVITANLDATEITAGRRIWPEPRIGGAE